MATLSKEKVEILKAAFIKDLLSPAEAAEKAGVTLATANRYYDKWADEITRERERRLMPQIEESLRQIRKKQKR